MNTTEILTIGGIDYKLKTRLSWTEQMQIDEKTATFLVSGDMMKNPSGFSEDDVIEMRVNLVALTMSRLRARLVGVSRKDIPSLPSAHVAILVERIDELENEEQAEIEALKDGNPIATN
jgi:hypothetical protein